MRVLSTGAAFHVEVCVIGAGVIGLATARALALRGKEVILLEREASIGSQTSSRNSEVIHAGIYYPEKSLKAQLCVRGKEMLYDYCQRRDIPHSKLGKLIVATDPRQMEDDIPRIVKRASSNGVNDLVLLSGEDACKFYEPEVSCYGGLFSPSTGVLDSHTYMVALQTDAENHDTTLAFNSSVTHVTSTVENDGIIVESEGLELICDIVVNCAGLYADKVANMIRTNSSKSNTGIGIRTSNSVHTNEDDCQIQTNTSIPHRQYYAKGNYYRLEGQKSPFHHLVYPVPEGGGLGVHATIDLGGNTRFGPDVEWIPVEMGNADDIDLNVNSERSEAFYSEVRKYWPFLKDGTLQPDYAGIRPKLGHPEVIDGFPISADFCIQGQKWHGVKGFVNLMGIESPGLTASMAIADEVVTQLVTDGSI